MNKATFFDYRLKAIEFINRHCELFTKVTIDYLAFLDGMRKFAPNTTLYCENRKC
jgi:hypothetical protein